MISLLTKEREKKMKKLKIAKNLKYNDLIRSEFHSMNGELTIYGRFEISEEEKEIIYFYLKKKENEFIIDKITKLDGSVNSIDSKDYELELDSNSSKIMIEIFLKSPEIKEMMKNIESEYKDHLDRLRDHFMGFSSYHQFKEYLVKHDLLTDQSEEMKRDIYLSEFYDGFSKDYNLFIKESVNLMNRIYEDDRKLRESGEIF